MKRSIGVREFRQNLADHVDQTEPVTITRYGQTIGIFVPVRQGREAELAAYADAAKKAAALLEAMGMTEDDAVTEFEASKRAANAEPQSA